MSKNLKQLRVHIVPVGFERDRVVKPLLELEADKVYLIGYKGDAIGYPFLKYAEKKLAKERIKFEIKYCNRNELFDLLSTFREIIDKEKGNNIYINVSSGGTFPSIAGMMSSMLFKEKDINVKPYYVDPSGYANEPKPGKQLKPESYGVKDIIPIPSYKALLPPNHLIEVMKFIEKYSEGVSKKQLIQYVFDKGIAKSQKYQGKKEHNNRLSPIEKQKEASNRQMWVNHNIIDKLKEWNLIEVDGKGKSMLIKLNNQGQGMVKFL